MDFGQYCALGFVLGLVLLAASNLSLPSKPVKQGMINAGAAFVVVFTLACVFVASGLNVSFG